MAGVALDGDYATTTIRVVGFPVEAPGVALVNLCRFLPGFVSASVASAKVGTDGKKKAPWLFVKFVDNEHATLAVRTLAEQPFDLQAPRFLMQADFARRELNTSDGSYVSARTREVGDGHPGWQRWGSVWLRKARPARAMALPSQATQNNIWSVGGWARGRNSSDSAPRGHAPAPKRCRLEEPGFAGEQQGSDTIQITDMKGKGLSEEFLREEFAPILGYQAMTCDEHIGVCLIRFTTPAYAQAAVKAANSPYVGFGAKLV